MSITDHLVRYIDHHVAAASGVAISLSGSSIIQSIIVGVSIFIITSLLKVGIGLFMKEKK